MGKKADLFKQDGKDKVEDKEDSILGDVQMFPTLEEFEAAEEKVSKDEKGRGLFVAEKTRLERSNSALTEKRFRERKSDALGDVIMSERDERDLPFTPMVNESVRSSKKSNLGRRKVNFANLRQSQRKARKSEPSVIGDKPNDGRDLEQDRNRLAETVYTDYDKWKDEKDESDLLGWDTPRDRIF